MSIFAPSVVNLWRAIESYGLDPEVFFANEDIRVQLPIDPCVRLSYEKIDRIRARAAEQSGDEAFGLRAASVYLPSQFGALGYAWHASLTLRKACQRLERFVRVLSEKASVTLEEADGCLLVSLDINADSACEVARDDAALAQVTGMCRAIGGESFRLQAVNFRHAEPRDPKPYFEYFGCPLSFGQPKNQLHIPLSLVDETLAGANVELARINDQVVTRRLAKMDRGDIVTRVQVALTDQLPIGKVSDEMVADALHMSVRTMHRKLAEVNQNFRGLLVDLRKKLAEQYILDNSLTLTEISLLLGFSEPSSFSRAFKNWTGASPSDVRQSRH